MSCLSLRHSRGSRIINRLLSRKDCGMAEIIVKFEDKVIERIVTEKKRISIGRTNDNDIVLENRAISRKHAMIEFNNNAAVIIDNESLNGGGKLRVCRIQARSGCHHYR
jgi:ribosomal protein L14